MATFPRHHYKGGRMPKAGRLVAYLAHHEKREASYLLDVAGHELTIHRALESIGREGIEGRDYWHRLICPSSEECEYLAERLGLSVEGAAKEHARLQAQRLQERCHLAEAPLLAVHLERESDGRIRWHEHLLGRGPEPKGLLGEQGHLQKIWDQEIRALQSDRQKIVDWSAHQEWRNLRAEHQDLVRQQRELSEARSLERRTLRAAQRHLRHISAADRWSFGSLPGLRSYSQLRRLQVDAHQREVITPFSEHHRGLVNQRYALEVAMLDARYRACGTAGSFEHGAEQRMAAFRRDRALLVDDRFSALERFKKQRDTSRRLRLASSLTCDLVPGLGLASKLAAVTADRQLRKIEAQYRARELELVFRARDAELVFEAKRFSALGKEGGTEHRMSSVEIQRKAQAKAFRIQTRGLDRRAVARLRQAQGRALSAAKRAASRTTGLALSLAQAAIREAREELRVRSDDLVIEKPLEMTKGVQGTAKNLALQTVQSALQVGTEAARTVAEASAKMAIRIGEASLKMFGGLVMALPTGGASLGAASKEAAADLGCGVGEATHSLGKGGLRTSLQATEAAKDTLVTGVQGLVSLGTNALPPAARESLKALKTAGRHSLAAAKDLISLDVLGAGSNLVAGGLQVSKQAAAALHEMRELPAAVRMPLRVLEAAPVVGTITKLARHSVELTTTVSAGAGAPGVALEQE